MEKAISFNDVGLFMLNEMLTEFTFAIWAKMMQLVSWAILICLIKMCLVYFLLGIKMSEKTCYQKKRCDPK